MDSGRFRLKNVDLYRRGQHVTALSRWLSLGLGVLSLVFVWDGPRVHPWAAAAVIAGWAAFALGARLVQRRHPDVRAVKVVHDVADALAVGLGAGFTGGMASPVWLLLYPHVVAVSVRGALGYALSFGLLDALIVLVLSRATPEQPLAALNALTILFCAFMGGTTSSRLHAVRGRQAAAVSALGESESRYRYLLERIQDGVVIIQEGRVAYANQVFADLAGLPRDALLGRDFLDFAPPEDHPELRDRYLRWERSQAVSGVLETRLLTSGGEHRLVSLRAGSVEFGGRRAVIATVRDITRERRMEEDVKANAERLAAINEIANAINLSLTVDDIASVVAAEARRLLPFDAVTLALIEEEGARVEVIAPGAPVVRRREVFAKPAVSWAFRRPLAWCAGDPEPAPSHFATLLPEPALLAMATVPLLSKDRIIGSLNVGRRHPSPFSALELAVLEAVARHIAVALDNARLLEAMRRRRHELESLLGISRRIGERLDLHDLLPMVARSVNRVMGTQNCLLLLRDGDRLRMAAQEGLEPDVIASFGQIRVGDSLSGWVVQHGPLVVEDMREDPRLMYGEVVQRYGYRSYLGVPLRRGAEVLGTLEVVTKGEVRRFGPDDQALMTAFADHAAIAIDNARLLDDARRHLEKVVEANRQLEELDRLRREYLRNVSHEFRTPLTVIRGYAEFLMEGTSTDAESVRGVMRVVMESSDRVIDLVETLIEVSRVEQEGAERTLQVQPLDLRELAATSVDSLRPMADKKGVRFDLQFPAQPLCLRGDRGLLHHLVRKLVDNAVKYSRSGTAVVVRGRGDGEALTLEVEDEGIGIAAEHVPHIFEKFYMADGGITRRAGGTGVGLYLVREVARLHNGTVDVESRPGEGSLFRVFLPRERAAVEAAS